MLHMNSTHDFTILPHKCFRPSAPSGSRLQPHLRHLFACLRASSLAAPLAQAYANMLPSNMLKGSQESCSAE